MLVLVLDTATPAVTAALVRVSGVGAVELLAERVTVDGRAHGELLGPQVEAVLAAAGARVADVTAVVAGTGPGPFTGLRVGLVTAAAIGQAGNIPTYGVCSLDGIGAGTTGRVLVATDARRREVYWAGYADGVRIAGPGVGRAAELETEGYAYAVGAAAESLALPVRAQPSYPVARELAALAAERVHSGAPSEGLTPLYLRRPDAVEPTGRKLVRQ
jgi:tRNA threonylcarbamoyl adenosine modification protein YeaZ